MFERGIARRGAMLSWLAIMMVAWLAIMALGAGCHTPLLRSTPEASLVAGGRHHVIESIHVPTTHGHDGCAAAALAAILAARDASLDPVELAAQLPWHDVGASPVDLLLETRRRGFQAHLERGSWERLETLAREGQSALVLIDAGPEFQTLTRSVPLVRGMHWAVSSGVARDGSSALLAATGNRHHVVTREEFLRRWAASDWCMILVDRDPAPPTAKQ